MERQMHIHWLKKQNRWGGGKTAILWRAEMNNYIQLNYSFLMRMSLAVQRFTSTFQSWPLQWIIYKPFKKKHCFLYLYLWTPFSQHLSSFTAQHLVETSSSCVRVRLTVSCPLHQERSKVAAQLSCSKESPLVAVPDLQLKSGHPCDTSRLMPVWNVKQIHSGKELFVVWGLFRGLVFSS